MNGRVARGAELGEVDHDGDGDGAQPGGPVLGCGSRRQCAGAQTSLAGQAELSSHHGKCGGPLQLGEGDGDGRQTETMFWGLSGIYNICLKRTPV